jgi:hypothetical protein
MTLDNQKQVDNIKEYYEILRTRQIQIIHIIKDTTELLSKMDSQPSLYNGAAGTQPAEKNLDNGIQLAFSMVNALANILDEQMKALNVWDRILLEDKPSVQRRANLDYGFQDYYEITSN